MGSPWHQETGIDLSPAELYTIAGDEDHAHQTAYTWLDPGGPDDGVARSRTKMNPILDISNLIKP